MAFINLSGQIQGHIQYTLHRTWGNKSSGAALGPAGAAGAPSGAGAGAAAGAPSGAAAAGARATGTSAASGIPCNKGQDKNSKQYEVELQPPQGSENQVNRPCLEYLQVTVCPYGWSKS